MFIVFILIFKEFVISLLNKPSFINCKTFNSLFVNGSSKVSDKSINISINTINTHRQNILLKLKANNSIEAVNIAQRLGLLNNSTQKHIFSETD